MIYYVPPYVLNSICSYLTKGEVMNVSGCSWFFYGGVGSAKLLYLNRKTSLRFYVDDDFRQRVVMRVRDTEKRLCLDLSGYDIVKDVSCLSDLHELRLIDCENVTDVSPLRNIHILHLNGCQGVTNVSSLHAVHTLSL